MSKKAWDLEAMKAVSQMEVEDYHRNNNDNIRIENVVADAIRSNISVWKEIYENDIQQAESKIRDIREKKEEIYENYSYADIQKGKFSKIDAKKLQELQEQERSAEETIKDKRQQIKDLENAGAKVSKTMGDLRDMSEESLMYGYPQNPRLQSSVTKDEKMDFTKVDDRVKDYQHQQDLANNLVTLAELVGVKTTKDIYKLFDIQTGKVSDQKIDDIRAKMEELNTLLKMNNFDHLPVDNYHFGGKNYESFEDRPKVENVIRDFGVNLESISRMATGDNLYTFLEWPEDDKRALKEKSKEPDYANQVCRAIDKVLESMGGIQGMVVSEEIVAKFEKLKAPYAKIVSKQDPEKRREIEKRLDKNERDSKITVVTNEQPVPQKDQPEEPVVEAEEETPEYEQPSIEARQWFDMWRQSGTGREFMNWLVEEKHLTSEELQKITGVETLFKEWEDGVRRFHEQQAEEAESLVGTIDPKAYAYYDAYSKSGSPLLFPEWCDQQGLEIPRGWEKVQAERFKGQEKYQKQQARGAAQTENSVNIDPMAYGYYDAYSKSGSPLLFPEWCDQQGLKVPDGWEFLEQERKKEREEYLKQQALEQPEDDDEMNM